MTLISASQLAVEFGATTLFTDVTFTVASGERWGIIGRNGSGKTTLLKILLGRQKPTRGSVSIAPGIKISVLDQHRDFANAKTVWEAAAGQFAHLMELERSLARQAEQLGEQSTQKQLDDYAHDLERFEREGGYTFSSRVDAVLHGLGFDPEEARTRSLKHLSGGERGRVGLVQQLVSPADVLLLDEPTNHLDLDTTRWLEDYLVQTDQTILLISHDRAFLDAVVDHVLHVENQTAYTYTGDYEQFIRQRAERRLAQQRSFSKQSKVIAAEEDYIRRNIAGQNTKQAKGRRKRLERTSRLSPPPGESGSMSIRLEARERGGDQVVVADDVSIAIGDRTLVRDLSAVVKRRDRLGIIGPNGAGKSTFLETLVGNRVPSSGKLEIGPSVSADYYRQDLAQIPVNKSLYDIISDMRPLWERGMIYGHLGRFGFSGEETKRTASTLSGGERARVALAMMMLSGASLLLFDEPTNHLDVESIEALEDAIEAYDGTVVLVSHDRALLRALCTRVWILHDTRVTDFDGSFTEWEIVSEERAEAEREITRAQDADRRARDKQRNQRQTAQTEQDRAAIRKTKRVMEDAETRVARAESRVAEITRELENPELYAASDGVAKSAVLLKMLEEARRELDVAMEAWGALAG